MVTITVIIVGRNGGVSGKIQFAIRPPVAHLELSG